MADGRFPKDNMSQPKAPAYSIGIDLGGSSVKSVAATRDGTILVRRQVDFDPSASMDWAKRIGEVVADIERQQGTQAHAVGLAAPGLASRAGDAIAFMPGRLSGLEGLNWTTHLRRQHPVPVLNDAHAALLGEAWVGAARGLRNAILLTLGTGVGGAAMVEGKLLLGEIGRAGHFGHASLDPFGKPDICGSPGSLELAMGNCTIGERSEGRFATTHDLVKAYQAGDPAAARIWLDSLRRLAAGIASFINILDPAAVIIGGGIARSGDALFIPLRELLNGMEWQPGGYSVPLLPAQLGEFAGALGSAYRGWQSAES
jgi:glucokinase